MKTNVLNEQTESSVTIPYKDLNALNSSPISQIDGTIRPLKISSNGNSLPVNVGGRIYFAGKLTQKGNYIVYDGRALKKDDKGEFVYVTNKDGKILVLNGVPEVSDFELPMKEQLTQFGLDVKSPGFDIYNAIKERSEYIKTNLVNKGARSDSFQLWNNMLTWYFPDETTRNLYKLTPPEGGKLNVPTDSEITNNQYKSADDEIKRLGIKLPTTVYLPVGTAPNLVGKKSVKLTEERKQSCKTNLVDYIVNAIQSGVGIVEPLTQLQQYKKELYTCNNLGAFTDLKISKDDMDPGVVKKTISPFFKKVLGFNIENNVLSFKEIKNLLKGEGRYSGKIPSSHIFDLDKKRTMNENIKLKRVVNESLKELSENKKRTLVEENLIIKNRLTFLSENKEFNSKKEKFKFFISVLNESIELNNLGLDEKVIVTESLDLIKTMFGSGIDGIIDYFKTKVAEKILTELGLDPKGWASTIISTTVGNIPVDDFFSGKVFKCNYLTPLLAKSITEGVISKLQKDSKYGLDNIFFDVLRNAIVEGIDDTKIVKDMELGLSKIICPLMENVGSKLLSLGSTLKDKALS